MIAIGEKSGQLEEMLQNVAKSYESQVEMRVSALTSLLEPVMIVAMGGGVAFIVFSILMRSCSSTLSFQNKGYRKCLHNNELANPATAGRPRGECSCLRPC